MTWYGFAIEPLGWRLRISSTPSRLKMWWLPLIRSAKPSRRRSARRSSNRTLASDAPRNTRTRTDSPTTHYAHRASSVSCSLRPRSGQTGARFGDSTVKCPLTGDGQLPESPGIIGNRRLTYVLLGRHSESALPLSANIASTASWLISQRTLFERRRADRYLSRLTYARERPSNNLSNLIPNRVFDRQEKAVRDEHHVGKFVAVLGRRCL